MAQRLPCEPHPATFCPTFLGSSTNSGPVEASVLHGEGTGAATESQRVKTEDACPEEDDDGSLKTAMVCHVEADLDLFARMSDLELKVEITGGSFWFLLFQVRECQVFFEFLFF